MMARGKAYSDKVLLDRLRDVVVTKGGSKYHTTKPTWNAYRQRGDQDPIFAEKVDAIISEADFNWYRNGIKMMRDPDTTASQVAMFKYLTCSKKSFASYENVELADKIAALEAADVKRY